MIYSYINFHLFFSTCLLMLPQKQHLDWNFYNSVCFPWWGSWIRLNIRSSSELLKCTKVGLPCGQLNGLLHLASWSNKDLAWKSSKWWLALIDRLQLIMIAVFREILQLSIYDLLKTIRSFLWAYLLLALDEPCWMVSYDKSILSKLF